METVTNNFLKLLEGFRKHPFYFIILFLMAIIGYLMYSQNEYIGTLLRTPEQHSQDFNNSLNRDLQINNTLQDSLAFYGADGIAIAQFHNGQYDLTGLPFIKVSVTYYVGDNIMNEKEVYTTRPLSTMNHIMREMWFDKKQPVCISKEVRDLKDRAYRIRMDAIGIKFLTLCPLTNIRDYPIGYISTGYNSVPTQDEVDIILDYQRTLASRVSGYLNVGEVKGENRS